MKKYGLILIGLLLVTSCNQSHHKEIENLIKEWTERKLMFPSDLVFTIQGIDTIRPQEMPICKYTIVNYMDSTGCTSCRLQLPKWENLMKEANSYSPNSAGLRFVLHPKDLNDLIYVLKYNDFNHPVCTDLKDHFNHVNKLPSNPDFQTFLLDSNNNVLAMGNPVQNPKIKDLYLKIIQGENTSTRMVKPITTVSTDRTSIDMDKFDWQQEQTTTFTLTNTGDNLLAIEMVDTSCGCIEVGYDKEPVRPGGKVTLQVTYKADQPEYFNKTLTVYCNAKEAPLRLTVKGNAE